MEYIFSSCACILFANFAFNSSELIATIHVVESKRPLKLWGNSYLNHSPNHNWMHVPSTWISNLSKYLHSAYYHTHPISIKTMSCEAIIRK